MLDHGTLDEFCRSLPGAEASSPFGPNNVVYKVGAKMFALLSLERPRVNLKCDPDLATALRERHAAVEPGYHMSKRHWNSVYWAREGLPKGAVYLLIRHSYALVFGGLSAKLRRTLPEGADVEAAPEQLGAL